MAKHLVVMRVAANWDVACERCGQRVTEGRVAIARDDAIGSAKYWHEGCAYYVLVYSDRQAPVR